jgi:hypothetical protein
VTFRDGSGNSVASNDAKVQVLESGVTQVAVVGDGSGAIRSQLAARGAGLPQPIALNPGDLPERPEPLAGLGAMVWAGDSSGLSEPQRRSLERWVAGGGSLVVVGGPDWQARTAGFTDLLPLTSLASQDGTSLEALASIGGGHALPENASATIAGGTLRDGAISLASVGGESKASPLLTAISHGAGRITFLGADLAADPLRAWQGTPLLLGRLIPDNRVALQLTGPGVGDEQVAATMGQALSYIPALEVPPVELLLVVIVGYILLIGPISYVVLRRRDRRDLAWLTAPLLVLVFSAGTYGIGWSLKGSQVIINEVAVIRTAVGADAASVQSYAGVFSPTRSSYDLTVHSDALLSGVQNQGFFGGARDTSTAQYQIEQGDPAHLRGLAVSVFGLQAIHADSVVAYQPDLQVTWRLDGGELVGTVRNDSDHPVEDVAVISPGSGVMVGTLRAGQERDFRLRSSAFGGQPVSEQVYGFTGSDPSSPQGRSAAMRRTVLDGLVGYGGGKFAMPVSESAVGSGGPYVVSWRPDSTPVGIDVDGITAQHYRQSIEVIGGSPQIGKGQVSLPPSALTTDIVSTNGNASQQQPGGVFLSQGEAEFRISLPLEAAQLQPTSITLLASQDPMSLLSGAGNAGGFPPGFHVAIYRPGPHEWQDLGELGGISSINIKSPGEVIDAGGQILVRVSAQAGQNGGAQIFIGARVEGVIP